MTGSRQAKPKRLYLLAVGVMCMMPVMFFFGELFIWVEANIRPAVGDLCCLTPADFDLEYDNVTFTGSDGVTLSGWYIPSENGAAVIMLHGYGASRVMMLSRAAMLEESGYGVLLYDLRGHGESAAVNRSLGWEDPADVGAALDYLRSRADVDPDRIGIWGFSVGGQVALRSAAEYPEIVAVLAEEPNHVRVSDLPSPADIGDRITIFRWRVAIKMIELHTGIRRPPGVMDVVGQIAPRPVMFITSGPEEGMWHRIPENFYRAAGEPRSLWNIPEAGHGGGPEARPEEFKERVVDFFNQALSDSKY